MKGPKEFPYIEAKAKATSFPDGFIENSMLLPTKIKVKIAFVFPFARCK